MRLFKKKLGAKIQYLHGKQVEDKKNTENHWAIIRIIRRSFEETGMAPMIRSICKETGQKLKDIYELFPLGPSRSACRVAGLPKPDGCV